MLNEPSRRGFLGLAPASLTLGFVSWPFSRKSLPPGSSLLVNQAGYEESDSHHIVFVGSGTDISGNIDIEIINATSGKIWQRRTVKAERSSDRTIAHGEITGRVPEGEWILKSGEVTSTSFIVKRTPTRSLQRNLLRALYLQRCGIAIRDAESGLEHAACHQSDALAISTGEQHRCTGGWHDAGDYGKYVATTSVVIGELLSLYLKNPNQFTDNVSNIPESGNGQPDLLSEMRVGLDWLVSLQRPDGALGRKVAGFEWPSMSLKPEDDTQERYLFGASTPDTAKGAAAMAIGARAFARVDPEYAAHLLTSAEAAWRFNEAQPAPLVERGVRDDDGSGAYLHEDWQKEGSDQQDRFWAALELYLSTGEVAYADAIAAGARSMFIWPASWSNPQVIGLMNYLGDESLKDVSDLRVEIRKRLVERADELEKTARLSPWRVAMEDFQWASNREVAARGRLLAEAARLTGSERFARAAQAQADYILGLNQWGVSFVTGTGAHSVQNPHHRLDMAARRSGVSVPMPGMLVGGPYDAGSDGHVWRDDASSFETNEFAIDYNAAFLSLLARLSPVPRAHAPGIWARLLSWLGY